MPCLLKEPAGNSPGVVTFTNNEVTYGVLASSRRARDFVTSRANKDWVFGIHLQSFFPADFHWPLEDWQSFVMWPEQSANVVADLPGDRIIDKNCLNFLPGGSTGEPTLSRNVDICVISRPSKVKRIEETLYILRQLMTRRPNLTAIVVVPDYRSFDKSDFYTARGIDPSFYRLPKELFSSRELKNISFICSAEESFGRFPLGDSVIVDLLQRSRFLLLTSHREGTPRVIAEALMAGTPCILSEKIECGVRSFLHESNCLYVDDDPAKAAAQIEDALTAYDRFSIDREAAARCFGAEANLPILKSWLVRKLSALGFPVEGRWFLDDLHLRLAGHGQKFNMQLMNDDEAFARWFEMMTPDANGILSTDPYDEETLFEGTDADVPPKRALARRFYDVLESGSWARRVFGK